MSFRSHDLFSIIKGLDDSDHHEESNERLETIVKDGFLGHPLTSRDTASWTNSDRITHWLTRGSTSGPLLYHVPSIEDISPVKYRLLFFSFINFKKNDFLGIDLRFKGRHYNEAKEYLGSYWIIGVPKSIEVRLA